MLPCHRTSLRVPPQQHPDFAFLEVFTFLEALSFFFLDDGVAAGSVVAAAGAVVADAVVAGAAAVVVAVGTVVAGVRPVSPSISAAVNVPALAFSKTSAETVIAPDAGNGGAKLADPPA
eukprot:CAMPEP_0179303552 /NCGR_PEP_ID=MMETSP0797-20121207/48636_1 /TAXON_ID=47934 /ORGANISM="Dinophysis acuminata, Strain DAEP01" /LENGTH=118 /DNA_ID=CAMNT_0021013111 /DNA_START=74 /DNA_END=431 /DNA_ORIENTATION=+